MNRRKFTPVIRPQTRPRASVPRDTHTSAALDQVEIGQVVTERPVEVETTSDHNPEKVNDPADLVIADGVKPAIDNILSQLSDRKSDCSVSHKTESINRDDAFNLYQTDWAHKHFLRIASIKALNEKTKAEKRRWERRRSYKAKFREEGFDPSDHSKMTLRDFIYYNPANGPAMEKIAKKMKLESTSSASEKASMAENSKDSESSNQIDALAPKLRLAEDGTIKIDEKSLVVEHKTDYREGLVEEYSESHFDKLTCTSYRKFSKVKRWSEPETAKFYKALGMFGTDFSMIAKLFPKRNRAELRRKFNKEDRRNTAYIDRILLQPSSFDMTCFMPDLEHSKNEKSIASKFSKKGMQRKPGRSDSVCPGSDSEERVHVVLDMDSDVIHLVDSNSASSVRRIAGRSNKAKRKLIQQGLITPLDTDDPDQTNMVVENLCRLLESTRDGKTDGKTKSSLVFVSRSNTTSSRGSSEAGEIEIHMVTEEDDREDIPEVTTTTTNAKPDDSEHHPEPADDEAGDVPMSEQQIRQLLGDDRTSFVRDTRPDDKDQPDK